MARKPIHLQAAGKLTPRDRIWAAARALAPLSFSVDEIARLAIAAAPKDTAAKRIPERTIKTYLGSLALAGYLTTQLAPVQRGARQQLVQPARRYQLVRDTGVEAPRVTKAGAPVTQGAGREALWKTMRMMKTFTRSELAARASVPRCRVSEADAKAYVHYMAKAGYVTVRDASRPGTQAVYRFVEARYSGPKAPMIQRAKHVYDPNLGQVVWHPEASA